MCFIFSFVNETENTTIIIIYSVIQKSCMVTSLAEFIWKARVAVTSQLKHSVEIRFVGDCILCCLYFRSIHSDSVHHCYKSPHIVFPQHRTCNINYFYYFVDHQFAFLIRACSIYSSSVVNYWTINLFHNILKSGFQNIILKYVKV